MGSAATESPDPEMMHSAEPLADEGLPGQQQPSESVEPPTDSSSLHENEKKLDLDAVAAEKARVQSLINRLVSRAHAATPESSSSNDEVNAQTQTPATTTAFAPASSHQSSSSSPSPCSFEWSETSTAASLVFRVPKDTRTQHVSVKFAPTELSVSVSAPLKPHIVQLSRPLRQRITVDSCWWALEDRGDGTRVLLVELEKSVPCIWTKVFDGQEEEIVHEEPSETASRLPSSEDAKDNIVGSSEALQSQSEQGKEENSAEISEEAHNESLSEVVTEFVQSVVCRATDILTPGSPSNHDDEPDTEVVDVTDEADGDISDNFGDDGGANTPKAESGGGEASQVQASSSSAETTATKGLVRPDLPKMIAQHRAAVAARGKAWPEAAVQLATLYHYGIGVPHDDAEAARLYRLGLENGATDASAAFQLGLIYNQGAGVNFRPDAEQAVKWWTEAANLGNSVAMFNLGVMCMNGSGCDMDPAAALKWFEQARALNPRLEVPQLTPAQLEQRVITARRVKKQRRWAAMTDEERERRRLEALTKLRTAVTATVGIGIVLAGTVAFRSWWRNRL